MTPKSLFNKQKPLRDYLNAIVKNDSFSECLVYVRAEMMQHPGLTPAGIDGARAFEAILLEFTDEAEESGHFPSPGLDHSIDTKDKNKDKKE